MHLEPTTQRPGNQLLISIVIPVKNRQNSIVSSLDSLKAQTYPHWEALVVDDFSTDDTVKRVQGYEKRDPRIKLIEKHGSDAKGANAARNIGLQRASGAYVIFLDSDDLLMPFCLERRVSFISRSPQLDFLVFSAVCRFPNLEERLVNVLDSSDDINRFLVLFNQIDVPWWTSSPIWKRKALERTALIWPEGTPKFQDVEFHLHALCLRLDYEKFSALPDCVWNLHSGPDRIGLRRLDSEGTRALQTMLMNLRENLENCGMLTRIRLRLWNKIVAYHCALPYLIYSAYQDLYCLAQSPKLSTRLRIEFHVVLLATRVLPARSIRSQIARAYRFYVRYVSPPIYGLNPRFCKLVHEQKTSYDLNKQP